MKKILLLGLLILTLGGCYDYYELNELAIVVGIGIDYQDEEYIITYEVISNNVDKESADTKSYTVTMQNESFPVALDLTSDAITKRAYFSHADLLVLSKSVAKNHIEDILDYLLRNNNIRETLNVVITDTPEQLLSATSENLAVVSKTVNDAIDADRYSGSYAVKKKFITMAQEILTFGEDAAITIVDIDNDKIMMEGLALFKDYKMIDTLAKEDIPYFNLLKGETNDVVLEHDFDGKLFSASIYKSDIDFSMTDNAIEISGDVYAQVLANRPEFNLKKPSDIKTIEEALTKVINEKLTEFVENLQTKESDILYLGQNYYNHKRIKDKMLWTKVKVKSNVNFNISKKGIIYEVEHAY